MMDLFVLVGVFAIVLLGLLIPGAQRTLLSGGYFA